MQKKVLRRERTWSLYCGQVRTGFGHAVSTSLHGLPPNFTHALKFCLGRFLSPFQSARLMGSGGNSPLSSFSWSKVWTGEKCNFSSAQLHDWYVYGKLPISRVRMWNFTRIRCKPKKLQLLKIPARRRSHQPPLGQPKKGVNRNFSWPHLDKQDVVGKLLISEA